METAILQLAQSYTGNSEIRDIPCSMVLRCLETSVCLPSLPAGTVKFGKLLQYGLTLPAYC